MCIRDRAGDVKKMPHHKLRYLAGLAAFVEDMSDDDASDDEPPPRRRMRDDDDDDSSSSDGDGADY